MSFLITPLLLGAFFSLVLTSSSSPGQGLSPASSTEAPQRPHLAGIYHQEETVLSALECLLLGFACPLILIAGLDLNPRQDSLYDS